jgi:hypothetical protein
VLEPQGQITYNRDTDLLNSILRLKDRGEMGCDLRGEVYPCVSPLVVEVYNYAGWVPDSVDEMSGDHFVHERSTAILWGRQASIHTEFPQSGRIRGPAQTGVFEGSKMLKGVGGDERSRLIPPPKDLRPCVLCSRFGG